MPTQAQVQTAILTGELKLANMVNDTYTAEAAGLKTHLKHQIREATRIINAVKHQYSIGDYISSGLVTAYNCLQKFIGGYGAGEINANAQNPGTSFNITIEGQGNFIRIPFSADGISPVTLTNFQALYVPIYGDYAIVTIWVTQDGGATYQQDTLTVPTIINVGGDINRPDSYSWFYPVPTQGYIQINGYNKTGQSIQEAQAPITNNSSVPLSNAQLNTLYPNSVWGQLILLPNANIKYTKLDNSPTGLWEYEPYNPNT